MKEMTCVHPRKAVWAMRDFLNEISTVEYIIEADYNGEEMENAVKAKRMAKIIKGNDFCAYVNGIFGQFEEYFKIAYNWYGLFDRSAKCFRKDFVNRCPTARGFADITLVLLHELGHIETEHRNYSVQERNAEENRIRTLYYNREIDYDTLQTLYFNIPQEHDATDWAIEWLKDPAHRKIAKKFEKKFFTCFA